MLQKLFLKEIFNTKSFCNKRQENGYLDIGGLLKANEERYSFLVVKTMFYSLSAILSCFQLLDLIMRILFCSRHEGDHI